MKSTNNLVAAGLILSLTLGSFAATASGGSMVESALKLNSLNRRIYLALRRAPAVNRSVVSYAMSKKGQKIGNGQCTELVTAALNSANARPGNFGDYRNYVWGERRPTGAIIRPGDIIQFEECKFVTTTTNANGTSTSTQVMDHHTAIVRYSTQGTVLLLHQNLDGSPVVQTVLNLNNMTQGPLHRLGPHSQVTNRFSNTGSRG